MSEQLRMRGSYLTNQAFLNGDAVVIPMDFAPIPATVSVIPVAGDTIAVSYSLDGGVTYIAWDNGPVTSANTDAEKQLAFYSGVTHLKFQRTAGAGTTSTWSIC